jgi:hypothetical protein
MPGGELLGGRLPETFADVRADGLKETHVLGKVLSKQTPILPVRRPSNR